MLVCCFRDGLADLIIGVKVLGKYWMVGLIQRASDGEHWIDTECPEAWI